jgi:hypothetical protein
MMMSDKIKAFDPQNEVYLGEGIYARFEDGCFIIKTRYEDTGAVDVICMEPNVVDALAKFAEKVALFMSCTLV